MFAEMHLTAFHPLNLRALRSIMRRQRRSARLDISTLPDHLKRDLGFLDGNGAPAADLLRD